MREDRVQTKTKQKIFNVVAHPPICNIFFYLKKKRLILRGSSNLMNIKIEMMLKMTKKRKRENK